MEQILIIVAKNNVVQSTESFTSKAVKDAEACFVNELHKHSKEELDDVFTDYALEEGSANVTNDRVVTGVNIVWI